MSPVRKLFLSPEERQQVVQSITDIALPGPSFYILLLLAGLIAAFGLLANSTATVIGAMVVAPLMGPIFGITLGLVTGEKSILSSALIAEISGVIIVILLGWLVGQLPLLPDYGSEILGRTQPTVLDLIAALVSGAAGAYCWVNPRVNNAIAGVAIAVALVPPLATCGLLLAAGKVQLALGALLLFAANFVAIQFAAAVIFLLAGLRHLDPQASERTAMPRLLNALGPGLLGLLVLGALMTKTLVQVIEERRLDSSIRSQLQAELAGYDGAALEEFDYKREAGGELALTASVLTPRPLTAPDVAKLEGRLIQRCGCDIHLVVRSLISSDTDRNGRVYVSAEELKDSQEQAERRQAQEHASEIISAELAEVRGAVLAGLNLEGSLDAPLLSANVEAPEVIAPYHVAFIQERLRQQMGRPVRLRINSILTHVAEADGFVYKDKVVPENAEQLMLNAQAETAFRQSLLALLPGSSILSFKVQPSPAELKRDSNREETPAGETPLEVSVSVRSTRILLGEDVDTLQKQLGAKLDRPVSLLVDSSVGASASASGLYTP